MSKINGVIYQWSLEGCASRWMEEDLASILYRGRTDPFSSSEAVRASGSKAWDELMVLADQFLWDTSLSEFLEDNYE